MFALLQTSLPGRPVLTPTPVRELAKHLDGPVSLLCPCALCPLGVILECPTLDLDNQEDVMKVHCGHFRNNSLFLLGDPKPPGGITAQTGLPSLFKDLLEFMDNKSDEISPGAGVLLPSGLVREA